MKRYDRAGRKTCGDPDAIFMAILMTLFYGLPMLARDSYRARRARRKQEKA